MALLLQPLHMVLFISDHIFIGEEKNETSAM
jgi:hypothetical protein